MNLTSTSVPARTIEGSKVSVSVVSSLQNTHVFDTRVPVVPSGINSSLARFQSVGTGVNRLPRRIPASRRHVVSTYPSGRTHHMLMEPSWLDTLPQRYKARNILYFRETDDFGHLCTGYKFEFSRNVQELSNVKPLSFFRLPIVNWKASIVRSQLYYTSLVPRGLANMSRNGQCVHAFGFHGQRSGQDFKSRRNTALQSQLGFASTSEIHDFK